MAASFPGAIKTFTDKTDGVDDVLAAHVNAIQDEIHAIEDELGTDPAGTATDLKTRLAGEAYHEVGGVGEPAFVNSWVNFGGSAATGAFWKDGLGIVHLKGSIKSGTINQVAFTLPAGYRPEADRNFGIVSNNAFGAVVIASDGTVKPFIGNNAYVALDGIAFRAA